jgi:hypothetical protein
MKKLKNNFCYGGPVETELYLKYNAIWDSRLNVLPNFKNLNSNILSSQIY